ncbi:MAG: sulfur carrier protein ThiS [Endozoicomonas sp.]
MMMQILVNNQLMDVESGLSLDALLKQLKALNGSTAQGVALAVNCRIISRSQWSSHLLKSGDSITLIKATAGG